ncbi:hypothetical protein Pan44_25980 [Caulifigura coniformis]|uniref:Uncharacterized protein n=1 Tax=Caulifigura coniformis TaxID=2527983 RepID=A0A517SEL3_9PLAN|nr:hypothetical protein [Caulifigura coniformis]QDT54565.1 hypothetical protein Pan44_25980 [Caulifigura coniformis]
MSIRVTCEKCGVVLKVKEELAGTKGKCPACKGTLNVPTLEEAARAAGAPLGASETAAAAGAGDTGALKIPTKTKAAPKAPAAEAAPPPPPETNGSKVKPAPTDDLSEPTPRPKAAKPAPGDSPRPVTPEAEANDDADKPRSGKAAAEKAPAEKPQSAGKPKLRMSETDAEDGPQPEPPAENESKKPAAEAKPAAPAEAVPPAEAAPPAGKDAAKSGDGDFDLDSFLMEGPKPKALPPIPDDSAAKKGAAPRPGAGRRLSMSDDETNVSGPSETLPPPNKGRLSTAESAMAALSGASGTASSAKDLLAKASQEGRSRAAQMPKEERERFDYAGAFKSIGKQFGPHIAGTVILCAVLYFGMNYMLGSNVQLPPLARVSGKVTLKNQPLAGVVVNFTPIVVKDPAESSQKKGAPRGATGLTDEEGNFELMYMEGVRGAVIGQNRVWIDPFNPENYKKVPGAYTSAGTSGDIREVKEANSPMNIELK